MKALLLTSPLIEMLFYLWSETIMKGKKTTVKKPVGQDKKQEGVLKARLAVATQQMMALRKTHQAMLETEKEVAFKRGYTQAMQAVENALKAKSKALLQVTGQFEKEIEKLKGKQEVKKTANVKKKKETAGRQAKGVKPKVVRQRATKKTMNTRIVAPVVQTTPAM